MVTSLLLLARLVVLALVLLAPLTLILILFRLGCDRGEVEFAPASVPQPIAAAPPVTLYQADGAAGKTTVALHQGTQLIPVAEEPSQLLQGTVSRLAVPSPDQGCRSG